jgi:hypothetical protein
MMFDWLGHLRSYEGAVRMAAAMSRRHHSGAGRPAGATGDIRGTGNTATMTRAVVRGSRVIRKALNSRAPRISRCHKAVDPSASPLMPMARRW